MLQTLLETTGVEMSDGAWIPEIVRFLEHFRAYKVVVYQCLNFDNIMFEGQV